MVKKFIEYDDVPRERGVGGKFMSLQTQNFTRTRKDGGEIEKILPVFRICEGFIETKNGRKMRERKKLKEERSCRRTTMVRITRQNHRDGSSQPPN